MASINVTYSDITATYDLPDEIGEEVVIGTSEDCSIDMPEVEGLAAEHCCITLFADGYAISDLASGLGTFADDQPVENEYMRPGVVYRIGKATITFVPDVAAAPAPVAAAEAAPAAPTEATPAATAPAAAPKKKVVKKKKTGTAAGKRVAPRAASPDRTTATLQYNKKMQQINAVYVILVLIAAFYAGMALYSWQKTGNPLPIFIQ
ncbi:MAG: FHA domain-containing protein [Akkermansia sp.]|nr:FHA domain-containing protein [Akkermansia sp.]